MRLVDTQLACLYSDCPRGTLYRWASLGWIARRGGSGRDQARWDLDDLPMWKGIPFRHPDPPKMRQKGGIDGCVDHGRR